MVLFFELACFYNGRYILVLFVGIKLNYFSLSTSIVVVFDIISFCFSGQTALHKAAVFRQPMICTMLVHAGADISRMDYNVREIKTVHVMQNYFKALYFVRVYIGLKFAFILLLIGKHCCDDRHRYGK